MTGGAVTPIEVEDAAMTQRPPSSVVAAVLALRAGPLGPWAGSLARAGYRVVAAQPRGRLPGGRSAGLPRRRGATRDPLGARGLPRRPAGDLRRRGRVDVVTALDEDVVRVLAEPGPTSAGRRRGARRTRSTAASATSASSRPPRPPPAWTTRPSWWARRRPEGPLPPLPSS